MGVTVDNRAQVSMNITNFRATPIGAVYEAVKQAALHAGAQPERMELIGLIPEVALEPGSEWMELLAGVHLQERTLERRLESPMQWP